MSRLSDPQIATALEALEGWSRSGEAVHKVFAFGSFADAIAFVVRLAFEAEAADHHPDLAVAYRKVTVSFTTHSEGGLTAKDLDGAAVAERVYRATPGR